MVTHRNKHWKIESLKKEDYIKYLSENLKIFKEEAMSGNINDLNKTFINTLKKGFKMFCKRQNKKTRKPENPWWDDKCEELVKRRNLLRKNFNKNNYEEYKKADKEFKRYTKEAKEKYWTKLYKNLNLNEIYKMVRRLKGGKNLPAVVTKMNGEKMTNEQQIANEICKYFSTVGNNSRYRHIQKRKKSGNCQLINELNKEITKEEIRNIVNKMNIKKAFGPDEVAPAMIKLGGEEMIEYLYLLYTKVFEEGKIPKSWFEANIIPIPKNNGPKIKVSEFRPISLINVESKTAEVLFNNRITSVAEKLNWIPEFQNGFRKNRSTTNNLIVLQQEIHTAFKNKKMFLAVFLDIKKAYDSVNRKIT